MADNEFDLTMRLFGPPRLRGKLVSWSSIRGDPDLWADVEMALNAIGQQWELDVKDEFARTHGRSGDTERSISGEAELDPPFMAYRIHIGGNIGFVINPLPAHEITPIKGYSLNDEDPDAPAVGRGTHFHSMFGPIDRVEWYQGGPESAAPDPDFYKGKMDDLLYSTELEAHKLANDIQILWAEEGAGEVEWSRSTARMIWRQTKYGRG